MDVGSEKGVIKRGSQRYALVVGGLKVGPCTEIKSGGETVEPGLGLGQW